MEVLLTSVAARQSRFDVSNPSDVSFARRAVLSLAASLSFSETDQGKLALIVTECATNILKHAGRGELLVGALLRRAPRAAHRARPDDEAWPADVTGIEIMALDRGPGIADMAACFADGFTTAGSPGTGLGAIRRQAHELDIWSWPQAGCVLRAVLWAMAAAPNDVAPRLEFGAVSLPVAGETACGDAWGVALDADGATFLLADGLGHGPLAEAAAVAAVNCLMAKPEASPTRLTEDAHVALRPTRGAALGIARLDFTAAGPAAVQRMPAPASAPAAAEAAGSVTFVGVGNIAAVVRSESGNRHLVSHNGIVGHTLRKLQQFSVGWPDDALLIMYSDGLVSRWELAPYPGLAFRHPAIIAAVLYRDFTRGRDDVTVLVARAAQAAQAASTVPSAAERAQPTPSQ